MAIIRSCEANLSECCQICKVITNLLLCLLSPILSASDLNRVMIIQKQEQQIVFAVDQTWDKSLSV